MKFLPTCLLLTLLHIVGCGLCPAITVVNDGFEIGTHPTGFRTVPAPGSGGVPYYASAGAPSISLGEDAVFGNRALLVTPTGNHQVVAPLGGTVSLVSVGDYVNLSFSFRILNVPTGETGAFRFGLHGSGTPVTTDGFSTVTNDDVGYYMIVGYGSSLSGTSAANAVVYEEGTSAVVAPILGGTDRTGMVTGTAGPFVPTNNTAVHTMNYRLELTASGVQISYSFDNGATVSTTDTTSLRATFDQISFSNGFTTSSAGTPVNYALDNIVLEASNFELVPEPAVSALAGIGCVFLLKRRR